MLTKEEIYEILKRPKDKQKILERCNQELREARLDACANGAICYDKDRVMSTPNDEMLNNKVARIIEAEKSAQYAQLEFHQAKKDAQVLINQIDNERVKEVCQRYYIDLHPARHISTFLFLSRSTVWRYRNQGIDDIYHKISC